LAHILYVTHSLVVKVQIQVVSRTEFESRSGTSFSFFFALCFWNRQSVGGLLRSPAQAQAHIHARTTSLDCAWPLWYLLLWHLWGKRRNNARPKSDMPRAGIDPATRYLRNRAPTTTPSHSYNIVAVYCVGRGCNCNGLLPHWPNIVHIGLTMVGHIGVTLGHFGLPW
jgi:hypothetical protein